MSNWVKFIYAWDVNITKFYKAVRLQENYTHGISDSNVVKRFSSSTGRGGKPFCITFNSFLNHVLPDSDLFTGKATSITLGGNQILQILNYSVPQALLFADRAFNVENNLAKYEAILFIHGWSQLLETQQAGLVAFEYARKNKIYCKKFVIPEAVWRSGTSGNHAWLTELGVASQSVTLNRDEINNLYSRFSGTRITF